MNRKAFFKLVEIQTKVASSIPFLAGVVFALYRYQRFDPLVIFVFFISLICLDMATTAVNNLMDLKIVQYDLSVGQVKRVIGLLLMITMIAGLVLVYLTDIIVLFIGMIAFAVGVLYSFGPLPISRTPFGEIFSGFFMGTLIFFITVYIQIFDLGFIIMTYADQRLFFNVHIIEFIVICLVSIPMIVGIANIMLANNICDLEEDIANKRHTLPYYIGKKNAIILFQILTYIAYVWIVIGVLFKILPVVSLLVFVTIVPVKRHLEAFKKNQEKDKTFICAVKNFVLISMVYLLTIFLGVVIQRVIH